MNSRIFAVLALMMVLFVGVAFATAQEVAIEPDPSGGGSGGGGGGGGGIIPGPSQLRLTCPILLQPSKEASAFLELLPGSPVIDPGEAVGEEKEEVEEEEEDCVPLPAYYSAHVGVCMDKDGKEIPLASPVRAYLGPGAANWTISYNTGEPFCLGASMAGPTSLVPGGFFLELVFDTYRMKPGTVASFTVSVRLNEEPLSQVLPGTIKVLWAKGDVDGDGQLTPFDASLILQFLVGLVGPSQYPGLCLEVADVSGNGEISEYDAALILMVLAKIITDFPVSTDEGPVMAAKAVAFEAPSLTFGATEETAGGFIVPILANWMNGVVSGMIELTYSPVAKVDAVDPSELFDGYMVVSNNKERGILGVFFAGAESPVDDVGGEILRVKFDKKPEELRFTMIRFNGKEVAIGPSVSVEPSTFGQVKAMFK